MKENENKIESTINQHCTVGPLFSKKLKNCEIKWEIVSNFVAFLEDLNFIRIPSVQQTRAMSVMFFCDASHEISAKIMVKTRLSHLLASCYRIIWLENCQKTKSVLSNCFRPVQSHLLQRNLNKIDFKVRYMYQSFVKDCCHDDGLISTN